MTFRELKDTKFYLEKYRRFLFRKMENEGRDEDYIKDVRIMTELIDEIRDEIITRIKKNGEYK
tara:strand:- start:716 stop:904 length:189 start_codon:yes stop_codon:yes gene_type:complete